jgi:hypothetical protein
MVPTGTPSLRAVAFELHTDDEGRASAQRAAAGDAPGPWWQATVRGRAADMAGWNP